MKEKDLLKDKEAIKLAVSFKKMASECKVSIPEMVAECKRIIDLVQKNQTDSILLAPMVKKLIEENEPDPVSRTKMLSFIDSLNIKGSPKAFSALTLAFFFVSNGVLTED